MKYLHVFVILFLTNSNVQATKVDMSNCQPLTSYNIYASGCYFMTSDMTQTIQIQADSVILDMNGKKLIDTKPQINNVGIKIGNNRDITIKNGYFEGFWFAIYGTEVVDVSILNNHFEKTKYVAINLTGIRHRVRGNYIANMDFSQVKTGTDFYLIGINLIESAASLIDNNVIDAPFIPATVGFKLEYVGIILSGKTLNSRIENNLLVNFKKPAFKTIAVWLGADSARTIFRNNLFFNFLYAISGKVGAYSESNDLLAKS